MRPDQPAIEIVIRGELPLTHEQKRAIILGSNLNASITIYASDTEKHTALMLDQMWRADYVEINGECLKDRSGQHASFKKKGVDNFGEAK